MVVLVHGGPHVRGNEWGWEPTGQFLASRGYLVVEPEFRGSTGYGQKLYAAGFKQWGLKMQDDIADAARWAIAKGMADPARVCIAGASYGGYATLMGLVRDPDLYKCGINWVGVTDMDLLYTGSFRHDDDVSASFKKYGLAERVGDRVKDAQQLRDTSPILHAAKIRQPLLMAYGTEDKRVPIPHGRSFHEAVKAGNKQVEFVEYKGEGHNFKLVENRIDFWTRVERFLERHIGK
jgi:dipeptidyl aminopeptidase/acylaminoacyl peptidase